MKALIVTLGAIGAIAGQATAEPIFTLPGSGSAAIIVGAPDDCRDRTQCISDVLPMHVAPAPSIAPAQPKILEIRPHWTFDRRFGGAGPISTLPEEMPEEEEDQTVTSAVPAPTAPAVSSPIVNPDIYTDFGRGSKAGPSASPYRHHRRGDLRSNGTRAVNPNY